VTLGVRDLPRSVAVYEAIGWDDLAADANLLPPSRGSFGGITLAINVEAPAVVDDALEAAVAAGGSVLKPGTDLVFGYGGRFADPDGHPWEVCYNPSFLIGLDGRIEIT
jgi:hypothetical protein